MGSFPTLEQTAVLAKAALSGRRDKLGQPMFEHARRVLRLLPPDASETERHVALLHDVVEDSDIEAGDLLRFGYPAEVVDAVRLLSHSDGEDYPAYVERLIASGYRVAMRVKRADNRDNTDPARLAGLAPDAAERLRRRYAGVGERLDAALAKLTGG